MIQLSLIRSSSGRAHANAQASKELSFRLREKSLNFASHHNGTKDSIIPNKSPFFTSNCYSSNARFQNTKFRFNEYQNFQSSSLSTSLYKDSTWNKTVSFAYAALVPCLTSTAILCYCDNQNDIPAQTDSEDRKATETTEVVAFSMFEKEPDYSLLPAEDEPTTCSICLINRQGPCRDPWRWFEKCMKATTPPSSSDDGDEKNRTDENNNDNNNNNNEASSPGFNVCMKASMTWMECVDQHRALYSYFTNVHFQPELDYLENNIQPNDKSPYFPTGMEPSLDLISYREFMDVRDAMRDDIDVDINVDENENEDVSVDTSSSTTTTTATKPITKEPQHLVPSYAQFKLLDTKTNYPIEIGYVKDQNGQLLGFDYFSREKKEDSLTGDLTFHLTPETTSITVCALYRMPSATDDDDVTKTAEEDKQTDGTKTRMEQLYFTTMDLTAEIKQNDDE